MKFGRYRVSLLALVLLTLPCTAAWSTAQLLNVSYDPTRELYQDFNKAFASYWKSKTGQDVSISQSHGGSGKQARAVIDGLDADVVTLALAYDIDAIQRAGKIRPGWQSRLPDNSSPYTSTIVLVVRAGNPKNIHDWGDLARTGVSVITPNPKTGGGARWNFLAAYDSALHQPGGTDAAARDFVRRVYHNVTVLDSGARGSTTTFVQRGIGDVLVAWENEALLITKQMSPEQYQLIVPSSSILAEPPVAVVDANVDQHHTRDIATAYLQYLYSPEGQEIAARHYYRPRDPAVAKKYQAQFPRLRLYTIDQLGGWDKVQHEFFDTGGVYDQISAR